MNVFIDTHSHIDMGDFIEDFPAMLAQCDEVGVKKIIIPGVNQEDTPRIIELIEEYEQLYALVGMHPEEAKKWNDTTYNYFKEVAKHPKVLGIGEIGLDYYWDKTYNDIQQEVFIKQIELAKEINKPIVVHDRDAHADTLRILKETNAKEIGVVLHCFSGGSPSFEQKTGFQDTDRYPLYLCWAGSVFNRRKRWLFAGRQYSWPADCRAFLSLDIDPHRHAHGLLYRSGGTCGTRAEQAGRGDHGWRHPRQSHEHQPFHRCCGIHRVVDAPYPCRYSHLLFFDTGLRGGDRHDVFCTEDLCFHRI